MYKLLLVTDSDEVLNAFQNIQNWEQNGFKAPHIRHDLEGLKDSLAKHHADGIGIDVCPEEAARIDAYLRETRPDLPIFAVGHTPEEALAYLAELHTLLNRLNVDFYNEQVEEGNRLLALRHEFFRRVLRGEVKEKEVLYRSMTLLRSRMDPDKPCVLVEVAQSAPQDQLTGNWHYGQELLEKALSNSFARDLEGFHILPTIHPDGRILVLACPLRGVQQDCSTDEMTALITGHAADSMAHMREYFDLELHIAGVQVLPALTALCEPA